VLRPCSEDVGDMGKGSEQGSPRACVEFDGLLDLLKRCGLGGRLLVAARREDNSTNGGSQCSECQVLVLDGATEDNASTGTRQGSNMRSDSAVHGVA
jgi:hypothetical protein